MPDIEIVPYSPEYRESVRDCVYETGFGGDGAECYFEDRDLFADTITLYYTDYEPESAFIPLVGGEPAGYLLGCVDTERSDEVLKKKVYPEILKKMAAGEYDLAPGVRRNIFRSLLMVFRRERVKVPADVYPAHLHIDLFEPYRRFGLGTKLINTYLDFLREKDVPGVHLGTSSFHTQALPFYEKLGFQRFGVRRVRTSFFKEISGRDFYNIVYVKLLR